MGKCQHGIGLAASWWYYCSTTITTTWRTNKQFDDIIKLKTKDFSRFRGFPLFNKIDHQICFWFYPILLNNLGKGCKGQKTLALWLPAENQQEEEVCSNRKPRSGVAASSTCLGECAVDCCDLCRERGDTAPRISAVAVESYPENMHCLIFEGAPFRKDKVIVSMDALALQAHDPETSWDITAVCSSAAHHTTTGGSAIGSDRFHEINCCMDVGVQQIKHLCL